MATTSNNTDPVSTFGTLLSQHDFAFLVYFRGHWCPFCMAYLKQLQHIMPAVQAKNGVVVAVTSEAGSFLPETRKASGFTGQVIVDPEHSLANFLRNRGKLDVAISDKKGYPNGMSQPAILVVKSDKTVIYNWNIVPSMMNLGGAKDRPDLTQVWDNAEAQLAGKPAVHKTYRLQSFFGVIGGKLFGR